MAVDSFEIKDAQEPTASRLVQWPIKLWKISPSAPYFHKAHLLILADCAALAYGGLNQALEGRLPLLCCPEMDYEITVKLADILKYNDIQSVTVVRMDSPCCADLTEQVMRAVKLARKTFIPIRTSTAFIDCEIVE